MQQLRAGELGETDTVPDGSGAKEGTISNAAGDKHCQDELLEGKMSKSVGELRGSDHLSKEELSKRSFPNEAKEPTIPSAEGIPGVEKSKMSKDGSGTKEETALKTSFEERCRDQPIEGKKSKSFNRSHPRKEQK